MSHVQTIINECVQNKVPVTHRVIDWNAARYEQEYDYKLAVKLLLEETEELYEAATIVDKLDAIGDICFVAIGVFWKLGFTYEQIFDMLYVHDLRKVSMLEAHDWQIELQGYSFDIINHHLEGAWPGFNLAVYSLYITALGALRGLGMQAYFYDIIYAICDSNDTKEIKGKVAANVKANISKGDNYVGPEAKLMEIYAKHIKGAN